MLFIYTIWTARRALALVVRAAPRGFGGRCCVRLAIVWGGKILAAAYCGRLVSVSVRANCAHFHAKSSPSTWPGPNSLTCTYLSYTRGAHLFALVVAAAAAHVRPCERGLSRARAWCELFARCTHNHDDQHQRRAQFKTTFAPLAGIRGNCNDVTLARPKCVRNALGRRGQFEV